jgi:Tol biopolymer transport system component
MRSKESLVEAGLAKFDELSRLDEHSLDALYRNSAQRFNAKDCVFRGKNAARSERFSRRFFAHWQGVSSGLVLALAAAGIGIWLDLRPAPRTVLAFATQLTETEPVRNFVLPAHSEYAYFSKPAGPYQGIGSFWHIYRRDLRTGVETDLTPEATWDCTQPAVSSDLIVFRSERFHGLVAADMQGHEERKLTTFGNAPALSPDGRYLAFTDEHVYDPNHRSEPSSKLYLLEIATGNFRLLTLDDALQPQFSPDGRRLVYWGVSRGGRVIRSISVANGKSTTVLKGLGSVWAPSYAPDGKSVIFVSDWDGQRRIWQVRVDRESGAAVGAPQIFSHGMPEMIEAAVGTRYIGVVKQNGRQSLQRLTISRLQESIEVGQELRSPDFSVNHQIVASASNGSGEDIVLLDFDGKLIRRLTNNGGQNRSPRFSNDGTWITYCSNQLQGKFQIYRIRVDGTGNEQLTSLDSDAAYPAFSPDAKKVSFSILDEGSAILDLVHHRMVRLPPVSGGSQFVASRWSSDGSKIIGHAVQYDGSAGGIWIFDRQLNKYTRVTQSGVTPMWLGDNTHILYRDGNSLVIVETKTGNTKSVVHLEPPYRLSGGFAVGPDDKTLFFGIEKEATEAYLANITKF